MIIHWIKTNNAPHSSWKTDLVVPQNRTDSPKVLGLFILHSHWKQTLSDLKVGLGVLGWEGGCYHDKLDMLEIPAEFSEMPNMSVFSIVPLGNHKLFFFLTSYFLFLFSSWIYQMRLYTYMILCTICQSIYVNVSANVLKSKSSEWAATHQIECQPVRLMIMRINPEQKYSSGALRKW